MNLCSTCSHIVAGQLYGIRHDDAPDFSPDALILVLGIEHDEDPEPPRRDDLVHYVWVTPDLNGSEVWGDRDLVSFYEQFVRLPHDVEVVDS